ncbi:MAG: TM2 domain-containing protein [Nostoc sp.]|uniref:TM2 domain-containing protein n=1 Tax=Nostoc sp. TaxID=1180 RepID=UPI002FEFA706
MTNVQHNLLQLAKQGDPKAIAALMNRSLQPKGVTAKVAFKDGCLQIMLESAQVTEQQALVAFVRKGITNLETALIERVKIYGKCLGEEFPVWNQELEFAGQGGQDKIFTFEESNTKKKQLQTRFAQDVLEQFMNLKARTSIGISYNDLPPVLGIAKLAVQKFERSPDSELCPYLTELIQKVMLYYELSLECMGHKVKRASLLNGIFIGLGSLTGIAANEPIGKLMASEFPNVPKSIIHGLYEFDTVLSALWIRAGELTYELDEILNKPVDLETLKLKKLEVVTQSSTSSPTPEFSIPTQRTTNSLRFVTSHVASADKKISAGIFAILLGTLGIHKFILGYTKEGVIMLLITLFTAGYGAFIIAIISIIEGIIYLTKSDREFVQTYVSSKKGWF